MTATPIYCVLCRKPVRPSSPMVRMSTRGRIYHADYADSVRPSVDQGWFEIGPDCNRKVAAAGREGLTL